MVLVVSPLDNDLMDFICNSVLFSQILYNQITAPKIFEKCIVFLFGKESDIIHRGDLNAF